MIEKIVASTIERHGLIQKGDYIILGLSGGPDSVCLFSVLQTFARELDLRVFAVHVNHMFRPGAAEEDQQYVQALCQEADIPCKTVTVDCNEVAKEQGITGEEAGRNVRYEAFYEMAKTLHEQDGISFGKIKIAVAQNKNDQAETVLMRILRGTGTDGLAGIAYAREGAFGTTVIRPLLDADRKEILRYCSERGLNPRMDHTNQLPVYTRNKIRLELLPYLEENFNENILETLARLARVAREDKECLWKEAKSQLEVLRITDDTCELDRAGLNALDSAIQSRVIKMALAQAGLSQGVSEAHMQTAKHLIGGSRASGTAEFPGGYEVQVSYDKIIVAMIKQQKTPELHAEKSLAEDKILKQRVVDIADIVDTMEDIGKGAGQTSVGNMAFLDFDSVKKRRLETEQELTLRTRKPGDFFVPKGMKKGRKKIQDYFVDQKIPQGQRDQYWLACLGNEVLWIVDPMLSKEGKINEHYRITKATQHVLVLEIHKNL